SETFSHSGAAETLATNRARRGKTTAAMVPRRQTRGRIRASPPWGVTGALDLGSPGTVESERTLPIWCAWRSRNSLYTTLGHRPSTIPSFRLTAVCIIVPVVNLFLTGGSGFVGSHVARIFLESGWQVRALVRNPERAGLLPPGIELVQGELADASAYRDRL